MDHMDYEQKFLQEATALFIDKKVTFKEDIAHGIDQVPNAFHLYQLIYINHIPLL